MKRRFAVAAVLGSALALAGCTSADPSASAPPPAATSTAVASAEVVEVLADFDLADADAVEVIDTLDRLSREERPTNLMASVGVDQLLITAGVGPLALDLPDDQFYLSCAPYLTTTHDCFYHSLTTCTGEVLVDGDYATFDNGFIGFWLPRDITATLRITYDGKTVEQPISTGEDAPTCLTTLPLA